MIFKEKLLPVDLYATARFGGLIFFKHKESNYYGFNPEYGIGVGVNYFFAKKFGIYADYLFGDFNYRIPHNVEERKYLRDMDKIRFGFVVKF